VPHGDVPFPAFWAILQRLTVRGSVVGTRQTFGGTRRPGRD
jgi:hypothetical protein